MISQYFTKPSNDVSRHHRILMRAALLPGIISRYWSISGPHVPGRSRRQRDPTSRRPIPERYTKNAASYLGPVCMLSTKLLVPSAGDAHVHPRGAADNKARFFSTRILPAPLARSHLAPAAKFSLHWSAKASLEKMKMAICRTEIIEPENQEPKSIKRNGWSFPNRQDFPIQF